MLIERGEHDPGQSDGAILFGQENVSETASVAPLPAEVTAALGGVAALASQGAVEANGIAVLPEAGETQRDKEIFRVSRDPHTYEVEVESDITLADYEKITPPEDWKLLTEWAKPMEGKTVTFLNPTMAGGGVAMLRPPMIHILRGLGVDAHWFVMEQYSGAKENPKDDSQNPFFFTKMMHNISQRRLPDDVRITPEGKALHQAWADENFAVLKDQPAVYDADLIVYDDPQPAPLIPRIKAINPDHKIVWRNHIDTHGELMADPTTPQGEIAHYLLYECGVINADAAIAHPNEQFVHHELSDRTYFAPATTEPHDDLNRPLSDHEKVEGFSFINEQIALKNVELARQGRHEDLISLMEPGRKRITLIARFDESKGMDKAMELGVQSRAKLRALGVSEAELPEVVIVGNGSVDDPSGIPMYEEMLRLRREKYPEEKDSIILMRLKHNYVAMNALMHESTIVTQTSEAEGFETRVSDAIEHGVPVVVSNRGGISKQVIEGESGYVLDFDKPGFDLERGSDIIAELLADDEKYARMVESTLHHAHTYNRREITTTANLTRFLRVFNRAMEGRTVPADRLWFVRDMDVEASR